MDESLVWVDLVEKVAYKKNYEFFYLYLFIAIKNIINHNLQNCYFYNQALLSCNSDTV